MARVDREELALDEGFEFGFIVDLIENEVRIFHATGFHHPFIEGFYHHKEWVFMTLGWNNPIHCCIRKSDMLLGKGQASF